MPSKIAPSNSVTLGTEVARHKNMILIFKHGQTRESHFAIFSPVVVLHARGDGAVRLTLRVPPWGAVRTAVPIVRRVVGTEGGKGRTEE